ncbi:VIT domain-containing protein, partial [Oleiagrimonas sp.]|uniref:VIT domain-containing protein n=1 Tax=Oleiagrimonas sp. TaxID=2010330 RepID=UPI00261C9995
DTDVHYRVDGLIADVVVHQRFRNTGKNWLQGEYMLPLPDDAAVYSMTMHIGKRTIVGNIREKQAARRIFSQARNTGRKAALVEAEAGHLFRTAVTNVASGQSVDVELHFWQRVDYRDGSFSLHFPLTYTPRYSMDRDALPQTADSGITGAQGFTDARHESRLKTRIEVTLNAGVPLDTVFSPSHSVVCTQQGGIWNVRLLDDSVIPDRDFILRWHAQPQTVPNVAGFTETVGNAH